MDSRRKIIICGSNILSINIGRIAASQRLDCEIIAIDEARPGLDRSAFVLGETYGGTLNITRFEIGELPITPNPKELAERNKKKFFDHHFKKYKK